VYCGWNRFKERYHLKKHVLFKHTDELREECRICGKRFKDSTAVRAHERTHSDERPYACPRCDKTFKTSECLWHHENRSKTCGKSLGEIPASSRPCTGIRARRGRQSRRLGRIPPDPSSHLALPAALARHRVFRHEPSSVDVQAVLEREIRNRLELPHQHQHQQQQASVCISSIAPSSSAQFAQLTASGSPDNGLSPSSDSRPGSQHHSHQDPLVYVSSAQFPALADDNASPPATDQPDGGNSGAGFVNFDCGSIDWDMSSSDPAERLDTTQPVVKVILSSHSRPIFVY